MPPGVRRMFAFCGLALLPACENLAAEQRTVAGLTAGAAAGTLVAQNTATGQCAYARGDGTCFRARCP